jgi:hypothetical protein
MMNKLVAHEMSHRFQMRDAVDIYPDARLIHEGGAEFLRWMVSLRKGWLTPQQAADELDDALATCMLTVGERSWRAVPAAEKGGNFLEYSCGLPAFVYAFAARQGDATPFARLDHFYAQLRAGARPDFAQALECGAQGCKPAVLPALLEQPLPMPAQWSRVLDANGLAARRPPSQSQLDAMMLRALTQLAKEDCQGKSGMTPMATGVLIDTYPVCATVRKDIDVVRVEGLPVFGGPQALPAMVEACASRLSVHLGLKDGSTLAVPCRVPYKVMSHLYAADIGKIMQALDRQ